jgi:hypothetical protein
MTERSATRPKKHLQVCSNCGGYMQLVTTFGTEAGKRSWKDDTFHRSFGGKELRKFVCEKCGQSETFQVDDLEGVGEDD